jgi:3-oxoacyl-[acyl-carrier-protein] synthase-1/3-oxoacyl-[acyl-carrier-protein] synthase II
VAGVRVLERKAAGDARTALKLSSAFGGANAALVIGLDEPPKPVQAAADVYVSRALSATLADTSPADLAAKTGASVDRLARADDLVRLSVAALAALEAELGGRGALRGAGIIVGHGLATIETNAAFLARIRTAGAARAEPRRFPYTTPNASAGECAALFGLTGPAFAVGGGPHGGIEALGVAADLVRVGAAERIVVVAVDAAGPATQRIAPGTGTGAVTLLVGSLAGLLGRAVARVDDAMVRLEATVRRPSPLPSMAAHAALQPLAAGGRPAATSAEVPVPWGGRARARLCGL